MVESTKKKETTILKFKFHSGHSNCNSTALNKLHIALKIAIFYISNKAFKLGNLWHSLS